MRAALDRDLPTAAEREGVADRQPPKADLNGLRDFGNRHAVQNAARLMSMYNFVAGLPPTQTSVNFGLFRSRSPSRLAILATRS